MGAAARGAGVATLHAIVYMIYIMQASETKQPDQRVAKLFMNGRSQAVRLPKEFRFEGTEVLVHREGDAVILTPIQKAAWPKGYWQRLARLRRGLDLAELQRPPDPPPQPPHIEVDA